jgi:2-keto-3-deoxy-L-rhamnonate aldolase RhmA
MNTWTGPIQLGLIIAQLVYNQLDLYKWGQVITIIPMVYPAGTIQLGSGNNYHPNGISSWNYHCQKASRYQRVSELQKRVSEPEA